MRDGKAKRRAGRREEQHRNYQIPNGIEPSSNEGDIQEIGEHSQGQQFKEGGEWQGGDEKGRQGRCFGKEIPPCHAEMT